MKLERSAGALHEVSDVCHAEKLEMKWDQLKVFSKGMTSYVEREKKKNSSAID